MSVFIKNMRIPTSCSVCAFCGYYGKGDHVCDITGKDVVYELSLEKRLDDCPLVELPPHGRLIDADALTKMCHEMQSIEWNKKAAPYSWEHAYEEFENDIDEAPTIVGAEVSG